MNNLYSTGGAARALGCSQSLLRKLEFAGLVEPPHRLVGSGRFAYDADQVEALRELLAQRNTLPKSRQLVEPEAA